MPTRPFLVLAGMAAATYVISETTGSGWLLVLLALAGAVLVAGAVLPVRALTGVELGIEAPPDATAGRSLVLTVSAAGRVGPAQLRLLDPPGGPVRLDGPGRGEVVAVPRRRGVVGEVRVELRSAAPFGLVWWRRRLVVPLRRPIEVGPDPLPARPPEASPVAGAGGAAGSPARAAGDLVRTIRHYSDGDPLRLVSWPATARHGRLMVKELEAAERAPLAIAVDLRGSLDEAEEVARRAAGLANAALAGGAPVLLFSVEETGPRRGQVSSTREVSRRLARAVPGPPPAPPPGVEQVVVGPERR